MNLTSYVLRALMLCDRPRWWLRLQAVSRGQTPDRKVFHGASSQLYGHALTAVRRWQADILQWPLHEHRHKPTWEHVVSESHPADPFRRPQQRSACLVPSPGDICHPNPSIPPLTLDPLMTYLFPGAGTRGSVSIQRRGLTAGSSTRTLVRMKRSTRSTMDPGRQSVGARTRTRISRVSVLAIGSVARLWTSSGFRVTCLLEIMCWDFVGIASECLLLRCVSVCMLCLLSRPNLTLCLLCATQSATERRLRSGLRVRTSTSARRSSCWEAGLRSHM